MSWMDDISDEQREFMQNVNAGLSSTRTYSSGTKVYRDGEWGEPQGSSMRNHSMFPYKSTAMAVDPGEVPETQERLRREGLFVEFDREGRPEITSTKQQAALATAMGMRTGRDGYGHTDEFGNFQNSGRRRNDEVQAGRNRVRGAIKELNSMPEEVPAHIADGVLDKYNIRPTEDNTG